MPGLPGDSFPGILKARLRVNEILSTIMLNAIALQLMNLLLQGPLMDPAGVAARTFLAQSAQLPHQVWLARLVPRTLLHSGAIVAAVMAVVVYLFLWRTTIGFDIRAVGLNPDAARYAGINVPTFQALSLTLAGGFAGLAGVVEVIGVQHRLLDGLTSGYGFTGIVAALLGGLHPLGLVPASILFGGLLVGADTMQRAVQVPSSLVDVILGLVILFVSGAALWSRKWAARRRTPRRCGEQTRERTVTGRRRGEKHAFPGRDRGDPQHDDRPGHPVPVRRAGRDHRADLRGGEPRRGRHHAAQRVRRVLRALTTGSLWLGLLAAALVGLALGLLMSLVSVTLKAEQGVSGIGLYMFGLGMSSLLFKVLVGTVKTVRGFPPVAIPLLGDIPFVGPILFRNSIPVYGAFLLVPVVWWMLEKTTLGMKIKSVGQNPAAADSLGISVDRIRYLSVCIGAMLAGIAGASLSISLLNLFQDNLTAGQGFIAVALVYFGGMEPGRGAGRRPAFQRGQLVPALGAGAGGQDPFQRRGDAAVPPHHRRAHGDVNRMRQPAALNKPFERGEN